MYCANCGQQNEPTSKFCSSCGKPLTATQQPTSTPPSTSQRAPDPGRGALILTFGILSIVLLGPFLGIPAWVMGHRDLKKIRAGLIVASQSGLTRSGMILGIIGTFFSPVLIIIVGIAIAVGLSLFSAQSVQSNRDAMINDLNNIAAQAYQYRIRPASMGGGEGSYRGFRLPTQMRSNENGSYGTRVVTSDLLEFNGTSSQNSSNSITVYIDSDGRLTNWTYRGDFQ
jgi:type II secretory pathway pseudopilin PulG